AAREHAAGDGTPGRGRAREAREDHRCRGRSARRRRLATASDVMMAHPLALQLRNLQTLIEVALEKNSTIVFPAPLMSTIAELGTFLERESGAAGERPVPAGQPAPSGNGELVSPSLALPEQGQ